MLTARLQKRDELGNLVDRRRQPKAKQRNTAAAVGLNRVHHRRMKDADRPVDLVGDHIPKVCVRSLLALEIGVHGRCEREGHCGVVANDLAALPRVSAVAEAVV